MSKADVVEDAQALWQRLVREKHLDPKHYDADLVEQLRLAMGLPSGRAFDVALAGVPAQDLVRNLLKIAEPFAAMLGDLLRLYADVGAQTADGMNLRLEFDFGRGQTLALSLHKFREQVEQIQRVVIARQARAWTARALWALRALVDRQAVLSAVNDEQLRAWETAYDGRRRPTGIPRPAETGIAAADEVVRSCVRVIEQVIYAVTGESTFLVVETEDELQQDAAEIAGPTVELSFAITSGR